MSGWELTTIVSAALMFISATAFAIAGWVRATRRLDTAIEVNRVLYADWQSIPVYVTDTEQLLCTLPDCPTDTYFDLPGRRTSLRAIVVAVSEHANKHHADEVTKWKAVQR